MAVIKHVQHIRSNELSGTDPKTPSSGDVQYGEIAINYHSGTETLFLRNDADQIVSFKPGGIVSVANTDSALTVSTSNGEATIGSALWALSSTSGVTAKYAYTNTATGAGSLAVGSGASATGVASFSLGLITLASASGSVAVGHSTKATSNYSHAEGYSSSAANTYAHAEGQSTSSAGLASHAEGYATSAKGDYSHSEGNTTRATGNYSHAEGQTTSATAINSHAEGQSTRASGSCSHAEGYLTRAVSAYSHAEGYSSSASGHSSHAEGRATKAQSHYSHAGGYAATAAGNGSFAHGSGVSTAYQCETAFGQYNARSTGTDASAKTHFSIGVGASSSATKSVLDVRFNGDIYITTGNTSTTAGTEVLLQSLLTTWDCGDYA